MRTLLMLLIPALMLALLPALTGCSRTLAGPSVAFSTDGDLLPPASGPGALPDPESPIPDVPRPIGFVAVPSRSASSFDGRARTVRHVYQGRRNAAEVVMLYRRTLPKHRWERLGEEQDELNATVMRYRKGAERMRIRIGRDRGITTVLVMIEPRDLDRTTGGL